MAGPWKDSGLGPALFEELAFPDGHPAATTLLDYRIPSSLDVPERLDTSELEAGAGDAEPVGIGESLIPAVAPAVAAAIRDATGAVLRVLPLAPERVLDAIGSRPETVGAALGGDRHGDKPRRFAPPEEASAQDIGLVVDGRALTVAVPPLTPLCDVLGDRLGIRSVRAPCRVGACGSCTVLVDRRAVRSCLRPVGLVAGASIVTVAGLPEDDLVTRAFVNAGAAQCGSCIPGFVLTTHDLLAQESALDDARIRAALAGNLCRCGTYGRIFDAVAALSAAPGPDPPSEVAPAGRRARTGRSRS